jgi:WD40-like Beta Propeller Repeat
MSVRRSRRTAAAIVLAAAVTALMPTMANAATPTAKAANAASSAVNGTKGNGLTISNGTPYVVMNGTLVDFHTNVSDLTWNPAGTKAAYIDSYGDLETANANGTGRDIVAIHPAGTAFSRPTWQVTAASDVQTHNPALDNLVFVATDKDTSRLESITATVHFGKPTVPHLEQYNGEAPLPQTGNDWPTAGGTSYDGVLAYDNIGNGEVYIHDDYLRAQGGAIGKGFQPAVSPNGEEIVFVRSVAGHDHLFVENLDNSGPAEDITPFAKTDYTEPTWSADGSYLAFRTGNGIDFVSRTGGAVSLQESGYTGVPAFRN